MEYRKAMPCEAERIKKVVSDTISAVYPMYYPTEVVEFFLSLHSLESITRDINADRVNVLCADGDIIGTGSIDKNHITRVFVLKEHQKKGCGRLIMDRLEAQAASEYDTAVLDASLPACTMYEHRGYHTTGHGKISAGGSFLVYEIMEKRFV